MIIRNDYNKNSDYKDFRICTPPLLSGYRSKNSNWAKFRSNRYDSEALAELKGNHDDGDDLRVDSKTDRDLEVQL